jgi:XTP/dITP diphosphohydrolase
MELVIASHNIHKIREFKSILKKVGTFDLFSLMDFPDYVPVEETGSTFEENAILKARHAATALGKLVLADDSGLVVPALKGAPGVYSARYAGKNASDKDNRQKLLKEMRLLQDHSRQAYFECVLALATPEKLIKTAKGVVEGVILEKEKGSAGFGYDSLFMKHEYGKTFAELNEETKNRISHRRKALDRLLPTFETLFQAYTENGSKCSL